MADPQRPAPGPVPAGPTGYVIRPPQPSTPAVPAQNAPANAPATAPQPAATAAPTPMVLHEPTLVGGMTQNGAVIGGAIMLVLAVVFFFLRGAVRTHLIINRASLASAGGAGWALFAFLFVLSFTMVFGLIGDFWTILAFIIPMAVLSFITLVLFVVMYNAATRIRR
jgi:hypothetical protein